MTHAVPVAAVRLPRRPTHRASLVVRAAAEELEGWQVSKLKQAYAAGRRQVQVSRAVSGPGLWRLGLSHCLFSATGRHAATQCAQVEKLSKDLGLARGTVLQWLKDQPPLDR